MGALPDSSEAVATPDYYNMLGISRKATPDEIKKAYRRLALRWHPDRNPGDAAAEQHFKDITQAYTCLSDAEERGRYDRLGPLYHPDGRPPRPEELNEILGTMWGNLWGKRDAPRGDDLRYTISVTLEEVATGTERTLKVPRKTRCGGCGGDGAQPGEGRKTCEVCDGTGKASGLRLLRSQCYHCDGRGYRIIAHCKRCSGAGILSHEDSLSLRVPAGVATGQKLKLGGKGNEPAEPGPAGDLFVVVNVQQHALFRRRGEDVLVDLPLTFPELALGADVAVPTLEGTTTIRIPPGTEPGRVFRLSGRGLPAVGRGSRGDLHLQTVLAVPTGLTAEQKEALAAFRQTLQPDTHPDRQSFDRQVEERR